MAKRKLIFSDRSVQSFRRIIRNLKKTSLIGGEDARVAVLNSLRKLGVNPMANSQSADFAQLEGEYRCLKVWDFLIYYKVEEGEVLVLDMIVDKSK